jgi:N-acetylglucosaminylphosphatidylinositol deacetylase
VDHPGLQDNPKVWWDTKLIESIVHEHVKKWEIDAVRCSNVFSYPHSAAARPRAPPRFSPKLTTFTPQIITFDDGGVSGHINHRAVSAGVR